MHKGTRTGTETELCNYLDELRAVPPPKLNFIGSRSGGPVNDRSFKYSKRRSLFASESIFINLLMASVTRCPKKELVTHNFRQLVDDQRVKFTHGDLCGSMFLANKQRGKSLASLVG